MSYYLIIKLIILNLIKLIIYGIYLKWEGIKAQLWTNLHKLFICMYVYSVVVGDEAAVQIKIEKNKAIKIRTKSPWVSKQM